MCEFESYEDGVSSKWIEAIDRGGLIHVHISNKSYIFLCCRNGDEEASE